MDLNEKVFWWPVSMSECSLMQILDLVSLWLSSYG